MEINILGLREIRRPKARCETDYSKNVTLIHGASNNGHAGVGLLLIEKDIEVLEWEMNVRMGYAKVKIDNKMWFIGVVYSPHQGLDDAIKDDFYEELIEFISRVKTKDVDVSILLGDFNAQVGSNKDKFHGKHYYGPTRTRKNVADQETD
uniref:Endo/exonuclease/phosphatase domain-containing protein n=1 Tax=Rhabditophanes sp. KR3021 TaxID=114890 RepID=A0AC35UGA2_9BILA